MRETCSSGDIGHTFIPGINGQPDIFPSIDMPIAEWNTPKRLMSRKVPVPRVRRVFFIDSLVEDIEISIARIYGLVFLNIIAKDALSSVFCVN